MAGPRLLSGQAMHSDSSAAGQRELRALCLRIYAEQRAARRRGDWRTSAVCDAELATLTPRLVTVAVLLRLRRPG
jgi:hypothetical protein